MCARIAVTAIVVALAVVGGVAVAVAVAAVNFVQL